MADILNIHLCASNILINLSSLVLLNISQTLHERGTVARPHGPTDGGCGERVVFHH